MVRGDGARELERQWTRNPNPAERITDERQAGFAVVSRVWRRRQVEPV
jgi:hypothetical protein